MRFTSLVVLRILLLFVFVGMSQVCAATRPHHVCRRVPIHHVNGLKKPCKRILRGLKGPERDVEATNLGCTK